MNLKACLAEFIGTFALIFVGVAAIAHSQGDLVAVALAHGLTIAVMVSATMNISGGQLNPAVTLGVLAAGKITPVNAIGYIVSQCAGAVAAAAVLVACGFTEAQLATGTPALAKSVSPAQGLLIEAVLAFFLMFVIYGTAIDRRAHKMAGLFIGLTVALDILAGGPLTGAAMNPARHLGPAILAGADHLSMAWLYWAGPVLGAVAAALLYRHVLEEKPA